jgi:DnaK suppressor protein
MTPASKGTQVKRVSGSRAASTTSSRAGNKKQAAKVAATGTKRPALTKKKALPVVKKTATPTKKVVSPAKKAVSAPAKKTAPAAAKKAVAATGKKAVPAKSAASASPKSASAAKKAVAPAKKVTPATKKAAEKPAAKKAASVAGGGNGAGLVAPVVARTTFTPKPKPPAPVRPKTGPYGKDLKFLDEVRELLVADRAIYQEQATSLRAEADSLALEREPGDVQFDEESGEGGTVTVDRERNLALSGQAVLAVEEIDEAMKRIDDKTFGYCERCFQPIPKPRLRALPYARLCVACKSGGLSRR